MIKFAKQKADSVTMSSDLSEVEQWIKNFHDKTYRPAHSDTISRELIEERENKKKKNLLIVTGVILLSGILLFFALRSFIYPYYSKSSRKLLEKQWYSSRYGHPGVYLETPEILQPFENSKSAQDEAVNRGSSTYIYGNLRHGLSIYLMTLAIQPGMKIDMDKIISNNLNNIKQIEGISDMKYEESEAPLGGYTAKLLKIQYHNSDQEMLLYAYFIQRDNAVIQLLINSPAEDEVAAQVRERIVQSVKIDNPENQ
jgi:hypothetical protein